MDHPLLVWLSMFTLAIVLVIAVVQWRRVRNSQAKRGEGPQAK